MLCRRHLLAVTWIAMLAIAMEVVAPTLARAVGHGRGTGLPPAEICTVGGIGRPANERASIPASEQPDAGHAGDACPYCVVHAGCYALPPQFPAVFPVSAADAVEPVDRPAARDPGLAWAAKRSRGPPASI
jgi:hypothetical protein